MCDFDIACRWIYGLRSLNSLIKVMFVTVTCPVGLSNTCYGAAGCGMLLMCATLVFSVTLHAKRTTQHPILTVVSEKKGLRHS